MKLPDIVFFKFIKQYPRVSVLFGLILLVIFLLLPGSLEKRVKFLILSVVLGFFAALCAKYFLARRKS